MHKLEEWVNNDIIFVGTLLLASVAAFDLGFCIGILITL
jgi:hypothetical protein